jgi:hypothetical protein
MKKNLKLTIPTEWKDIQLGKWLLIQKDLENYKDEVDAQMGILIHHFTGLEFDDIVQLTKDSYDTMKTKIESFPNPEELELQRFITIDGVEYGFEPNLSNIAYGAYVDITQYQSITIDKNWSKIMSILYRPVTKKLKDLYEIEPYSGNIDGDKWLEVTMDVHYGAMFFFLHTSMDLVQGILNSLKEMELPPNIKSTLEKSGKAMLQFTNSQTEISKKWML